MTVAAALTAVQGTVTHVARRPCGNSVVTVQASTRTGAVPTAYTNTIPDLLIALNYLYGTVYAFVCSTFPVTKRSYSRSKRGGCEEESETWNRERRKLGEMGEFGKFECGSGITSTVSTYILCITKRFSD